MLSEIAGTDAAGAVKTIRKVFGVGGRGSEFTGGRTSVGIGGGGRDRQDVGDRIGGGAYGRRGGGRGARKLQPTINGSLFQSAKVADLQVARVYDVRIWQRSWRERSVLFVFGFEHRCVWTSQRTGKNAGREVRGSGRPVT